MTTALRRHTEQEIRATRQVPLCTASVLTLTDVLGAGDWAVPMEEMSPQYEAHLRSLKYLGHWQYHRRSKDVVWIRKSYLYRRVCCLSALYPALRLVEVVELAARQDRDGINTTLTVVASGPGTDEEKAEYRDEGLAYLTLVFKVGCTLHTRELAQTCTLPPSGACAADATHATQTKIEIKQEMNITNQYAGHITNVESQGGAVFMGNVDTQGGAVVTGSTGSPSDGVPPAARPAQMPCCFAREQGLRLWDFLVEHELVDETFTRLSNALYVLGCTDTPPGQCNRILWLGTKQQLREVVMRVYAPAIGRHGGITNKAVEKEITPSCFEDKTHRPIALANDREELSPAIDAIRAFLDREWQERPF